MSLSNPVASRLGLLATSFLLGVPLSTPSHAQCTVDEFSARGADLGDRFGSALAWEGSTALVGASNADGVGLQSGRVFVFDATTGKQTLELVSPDIQASDQFGFAVALSDGIALIGAPFVDDGVGFDSGAAFLFDAATGAELHRLDPGGASTGDRFGWSVALDDGVALVGAYRDGIGGSASLFDVASGQELHLLVPADLSPQDSFGWSVALGSGVAVVGALTDNNGGLSGSAYVFDVSTGTELLKLLPSSTTSATKLGSSVHVEGSDVFVGATNGPLGVGEVYRFDLATGQELAKYEPLGGAFSGDFGSALALDAGVLAVGAFRSNGSMGGGVYLFDVATATQIDLLVPQEGGPSAEFGYAVAMQGTGVLGGAPEALVDSDDVGRVWWIDHACQLEPDFVADAVTGGAPLSVTFTDLSTGTPTPSSWTWDFGDGGSSSAQDPAHVYATPGTYDVRLTVGNGAGTRFEEKVDYVLVVEGGGASATVTNGIGINPEVFASSTLPILGTDWISTVDGGSAGSSSGLCFVFGYFGALDPGVVLGVGELLVDPTAPFALLDASVLFAGTATHDLSVPNDVSLIGRAVNTQAFLNLTTSGSGQLTNAIELVFGNF